MRPTRFPLRFNVLLNLGQEGQSGWRCVLALPVQEVSDVYAEHVGDPEKGRDARVRRPGFHRLVCRAAYAGREEDGFLGAVVVQPADPDAVTDGASLAVEPLVVVGQGRHSVNAVPKMIISQPGLPGII